MTLSINNQIALNQSWYEAADPFAEMGYRTGYATEDVFALSFEQRVEAVWGEEIASLLIKPANERKKPDDVLRVGGVSHIEVRLFSIWCALALRQEKKIVCPVLPGEQFLIPSLGENSLFDVPGAEFIKVLGKEVPRYEVKYGTLNYEMWQKLGVSSGKECNSRIKELCGLYKVSFKALKQALLGLVYAEQNPEVKTLVLAGIEPVLNSLFTLPDNLVFVNNWCRSFDFHATHEDVYHVCKELEKVLGKDPSIRVVDAEDTFTIVLDNEHEFIITTEGVWQKSRMRRFNNMLLINTLTGKSQDTRVDGNDMQLINSFGSFIWGLLNQGCNHLKQNTMSQFNKWFVGGEVLPMVAKDEVGAGDADRTHYEQYVTIEREAPSELPFALYSLPAMGKSEQRLKLVYSNSEIKVRKESDIPSFNWVDQAALRTFNLVRMPRGMFIDARRSCVQLQHIDPQLQHQYLRLVYADLRGVYENAEIATSAREEYKLQGMSDTQVIKYLCEYLTVSCSSKLNKLIKRTAMDSALVGLIKDGESRGFIRYGQPDISVNNWVVEACVTTRAIFPAGVAGYWGEHPVMVVEHTQSIQPNVPTPKDLKSAVVCDFGVHANEPTLNNGWWEISMKNQIPVNKGSIVGRVPYKVGEDQYFYYLTNQVEAAKLVSIRWKTVKAFGNSSTLKVQFVVTTDESQLKGRNNVKAMISRYFPECIHNNLNEEALLARSVFFADTNKWLDLLMQHVDVAACTATKNQDSEGLELIRKANQATGLDTDQYLEWSPVLALLGTYKPLINWFDNKFGKAVWFRHNDGVAGDWVNVLRQMYVCQPEGWQLLTDDQVNNLLPGVIPISAKDVKVVIDGDINDKKNNILVFYILDGEHYFVQRAWSYVGTNDTGPVWQPVKGELGSVRSIVGQTPMMAGTVRNMEQSDPDFAQKLIKDTTLPEKVAAFRNMLDGITIDVEGEELPIIELGSDKSKQLLQTEELKQFLNNPENQQWVLEELAILFGNVMFLVKSKNYTINLAAVYSQDSNKATMEDTMSANITNMFVQFINGVNIDTPLMLNLQSRIFWALKDLCDSDGFAKAPVQCRMGTQAKTIALPGIPASHIYVRYSERFNSVFQNMKRTYGYGTKDLEGKKVAISRAPLVSPGFALIHVIYDNDERWADVVEEDTVYFSSITAIADRGDNDGDNRTFTLVEDHLQ
jgi:hypothetical protein